MDAPPWTYVHMLMCLAEHDRACMRLFRIYHGSLSKRLELANIPHGWSSLAGRLAVASDRKERPGFMSGAAPATRATRIICSRRSYT